MIKKSLLGLILLGGTFILINRLLGLSERRVETALSYVTYPLLRVQKAVVHLFSKPSVNTRQLLSDFEHVVRERDALQSELIALKALERTMVDTAELRACMKRYQIDNALHAPILLRNFAEEHFYLVDAGAQSGVTQDMIALYKNTIVGKVTQVYPSYSKVMLITDPQCYVAAFCASNNVKGLHHGYKKDRTTLAYVDHRDTVPVGDLVLSSGEGGFFPRGFGLGKITDVDQGGYGRLIVITPLTDLKAIEYCSLVPHTVIANAQEECEMKEPAAS